MKTYNFTLSVQVDAHDWDELQNIAKAVREAVLNKAIQPYKVEVEVLEMGKA